MSRPPRAQYWASFKPGEEPVIGPVEPVRCGCGAWRLPDRPCTGCVAFAAREEAEYGGIDPGCLECADIAAMRRFGMTWVGVDRRLGKPGSWAYGHAQRHNLEDLKPCAYEQPAGDLWRAGAA